MDAVVVVGWVAAFVGTILGIPQGYRLLRTRNVQGVSVMAWQATLAVNLAWLAHGVMIGQLNLIVVNVFSLLSTLTILVVLSRELPLPIVGVIAPGLLIAVAMIAVDLWLGAALYGAFAAIPAVAGQLTQSVELVRAKRVQGVSTAFLALGFLNFALWTTWGFLAGDQAAFIASLAAGVVALFNLVWLLLRLSGLGPISSRRPTTTARGPWVDADMEGYVTADAAPAHADAAAHADADAHGVRSDPVTCSG